MSFTFGSDWGETEKEAKPEHKYQKTNIEIKQSLNITFTDIALSARINKNATNLVYGFIHENEKVIFPSFKDNENKTKEYERVIPSEIFIIILAFFPSEIPFYDHLFEIQVIGDHGTGKTSLIGDEKEKIIKINRNSKDENEIVQLRLYDVDANDLFNSNQNKPSKNYFGDGIMILFDLTNRKSFTDLNKLNLGQNQNDIIKLLVGNKCDCDETQKVVSNNEAMEFAKEKEIKYIEISTKANININKLYETISIAIANKYDDNHRLFMSQWDDYKEESDQNKEENKSSDNKLSDNNIYIGTKKYFENNDFVPFKQTDANRNDRVYYYQNICLSNPIFNGKSPEELRFEDKYNQYSIKGGTKINNTEKTIIPKLSNNNIINDDQKTLQSEFTWSFNSNNNNSNNNNNNNNTNAFAWNWSNDNKDNNDKDNNDNDDSIKRAPTEKEIIVYSNRFHKIYTRYNKEKVKNIPDLFDKYSQSLDQIHQLYLRICNKYNAKSEPIYISKPTQNDKYNSNNNKNDNKSKIKVTIDDFIINQVRMKCNVSKNISKQSLESSLWNAEIAINKINSLKHFNCDLSIFDKKYDDNDDDDHKEEEEEEEKIEFEWISDKKITSKDVNRAANNLEICVYQHRLRNIYKLYESEKMDQIKNLIDKNKHRLSLLHQLYFRACLKYQISAKEMFISQEQEQEQEKEKEKEQETLPISKENANKAFSLLFGSTTNNEP